MATRSSRPAPDSVEVPRAENAPARSRRFSPDILSSPPPGRPRSLVNALIVFFLLWQTAAPLSYYLGDDKSDERFAWRMFSSVNLLQETCIVSLGEWRPDGSLRALRSGEFIDAVPPGWMRLLHRDRVRVVERFLARHCRLNPGLEAVEIIRKCRASYGAGETLDGFRMSCLTRFLTRSRDLP